ncbi:MAG: hypothetical protein F4Z51_07400 [Chloroflexi bacterium]|nr:hypothetical protein [Chloroflexota bacterium]MXX32041.1 hypothetical protein [Chloroflexota bacterium]MYD16540.1 hypothetical protein [Chloroflexota bacterium]MYJ00922.1 hypothetical protein [Chloroflexota bacterium]
MEPLTSNPTSATASDFAASLVSISEPAETGLDWALAIGIAALVLSIFANYGSFRSTLIQAKGDVESMMWSCRTRWSAWRVRKMGDTVSAANYLKGKGPRLTVEVLSRMCDSPPDVPALKGGVNRIFFEIVDERVKDIACHAYQYYQAVSHGAKAEMDLELNVLSFTICNLYARYYELLKIPCAMSMSVEKQVEGHFVEVWIPPVGGDQATLHWTIFPEAGRRGTPMMVGELTARPKNSVFWERIDFKILR